MTPFEQLMAGATAARGGKQSVTPFDQLMALEIEQPRAPPKKAAPVEAFQRAGRQGVIDVVRSTLDPAALWLESKLGPIGTGMGFPSAAQAAETRNALTAQYEADPQFPEARMITSGAAVVPATVLGGGALAGAGKAGQFLAGQGGGALLPRMASQAAGGALQGAAGAGMLSSQSDEPIPDQIATGAAFGGALGAAFPVVGAVGRGVVNAVRGGGVAPETAALAKRAGELGIDVRGGQISNSPFVKILDSVISRTPGSGYAGLNESQRRSFTRAVSKTFGEDTDAVTAEVMSRARARIGSMFDDVAAKSSVNATPEFIGKLEAIVGEAAQVLPDIKPLELQIRNIVGKIDDNSVISGEAYQALTRKGTPLSRAEASADPNIRFYASKIRDALDDALEGSIAPELREQLRAARYQYKNMKTIEDLAEKAIDGQIRPELLQQKVIQSFDDFAYSGAGELGDLAKIGKRFIQEPPSSNTAERLGTMALLGGAGGAATAMSENPLDAIKNASLLAGGLLAARGAGAILNSPAYRNRLLDPGLNRAASQMDALNVLLAPGKSPVAALVATENLGNPPLNRRVEKGANNSPDKAKSK